MFDPHPHLRTCHRRDLAGHQRVAGAHALAHHAVRLLLGRRASGHRTAASRRAESAMSRVQARGKVEELLGARIFSWVLRFDLRRRRAATLEGHSLGV